MMSAHMLNLLGVALVFLGFALRLNALAVVTAASVVTCLVAGFSLHDTATMLGQLFVDNRFMVMPVILMVPVVGLLERAGLRERVISMVEDTRATSPGRVLWLYQLVRGVSSMFGLSIGNHASMVRPLIAPLAEGAAQAQGEELDEASAEGIRAHAAAAENVGNFFADDIVVAVGALLLIQGFFDSVGVAVTLRHLKWWSLPTAICAMVVGLWRYRVLDAELQRRRSGKERAP
jgi:uncharacterized membrane protein